MPEIVGTALLGDGAKVKGGKWAEGRYILPVMESFGHVMSARRQCETRMQTENSETGCTKFHLISVNTCEAPGELG